MRRLQSNAREWERKAARLNAAREPVEAVADCDVDRLTEDAVPALRVGDHLRVAAAHVQHRRVARACHLAAHLDIWQKAHGKLIGNWLI